MNKWHLYGLMMVLGAIVSYTLFGWVGLAIFVLPDLYTTLKAYLQMRKLRADQRRTAEAVHKALWISELMAFWAAKPVVKELTRD